MILNRLRRVICAGLCCNLVLSIAAAEADHEQELGKLAGGLSKLSQKVALAKLVVRDYEEKDFSQLAKLHKAGIHGGYCRLAKKAGRAVQKEFELALKQKRGRRPRHIKVATIDDKVVGFVVYYKGMARRGGEERGKWGGIWAVFTDKRFDRVDIAKPLVEAVTKELKDAGIEKPVINVKKNDAALEELAKEAGYKPLIRKEPPHCKKGDQKCLKRLEAWKEKHPGWHGRRPWAGGRRGAGHHMVGRGRRREFCAGKHCMGSGRCFRRFCKK